MKDLNANEIKLIFSKRDNHFMEMIDSVSGECVCFSVEIEADYTPFERETLESPQVDEELVITRVKAPFGEIDLDCISNLEQVQVELLEAKGEG